MGEYRGYMHASLFCSIYGMNIGKESCTVDFFESLPVSKSLLEHSLIMAEPIFFTIDHLFVPILCYVHFS